MKLFATALLLSALPAWAFQDTTSAPQKPGRDRVREYDIRSANIRFGEPIGQVKGYYRADFADAWARYCPTERGEPSQSSQSSPPSSDRGRPETWDGSSRPTGKAVPGLTCDGTTGTTGTGTPHFDVIDGGAA